jgi:hypothetical protein
MKKAITLTIIAFLAIVACSKDNGADAVSKYPEENPLPDFLKATGFNETTANEEFTELKEFFIDIKPSFKGRINSFIIKAPVTQAEVDLVIIDLATNKAIKNILIDVVAGRETVKIIDPIVLEKDKSYRIAVDVNSVYNRQKTNKLPATYPVKVGNISITKFGVRRIRSTIEEVDLIDNYYSGDFSFNYQRLE